MLEQEFKNGRHPVLYLSQKLTDTEKRYAVIKKKNDMLLLGVLNHSELFLKVVDLLLSLIVLHFNGLLG